MKDMNIISHLQEKYANLTKNKTEYKLGRKYTNHFIKLFRIYEKRNLKGLKILDVGCFNGSFLEPLVNDNECYGVDISEEGLDIAKKKGIKVFKVDLEKGSLPFPNNFFDIVVSTHTLEHIFNTDHVLREIWRVLKPKGVFYVVVPNTNTIIGNLFKIIFDLPFYNEARYKSLHVRNFTLTLLEIALILNGFKIIRSGRIDRSLWMARLSIYAYTHKQDKVATEIGDIVDDLLTLCDITGKRKILLSITKIIRRIKDLFF